MRLYLKFKLMDEYLVLDYRKMLLSFIKKSLSEYSSGIYYNDYYNDDISKNQKKDYSFSMYLKKPVFEKNYIKVEGREVMVTFVTPDRLNGIIFYNAFMNQRGKSFKISEKNEMELDRVKILREKNITKNMIDCKVLSPIVLRIHQREGNKDRYVSIGDDDFILELKNNLKRNFKDFEKEIDSLKMDISRLKKIIVLFYGQKFPVTIGEISFFGDKNLLNKIYTNSIGSRKSSGFGVLDLINEWEMVE